MSIWWSATAGTHILMTPVEYPDVCRDHGGRWCWGGPNLILIGHSSRPGFDRWRFAWTRAKHLRRAAEKWQVLQVAVHLSAYDTDVNDTGEYLTVLRRSTGAREMRDAYYEAAEHAEWGTR